jgi:hypothetical protein
MTIWVRDVLLRSILRSPEFQSSRVEGDEHNEVYDYEKPANDVSILHAICANPIALSRWALSLYVTSPSYCAYRESFDDISSGEPILRTTKSRPDTLRRQCLS